LRVQSFSFDDAANSKRHANRKWEPKISSAFKVQKFDMQLKGSVRYALGHVARGIQPNLGV
jgi:hypothetical protein